MSSNTDHVFLYAILLGCTPKGRNTEQHDMLFGVAKNVEELYGQMKTFWYKPIVEEMSNFIKKELPDLDTKTFGANLLKSLSHRDKVHVDAWMKVEFAGEYKITIHKKTAQNNSGLKLYFINLGGYKTGEFEEFHKKLFVVASSVTDAMAQLRNHDFMRQYTPIELGTKAKAHFDDKHEIEFEADDIVCLSETIEDGYEIFLEKANALHENEMVIGYVPLDYKEPVL